MPFGPYPWLFLLPPVVIVAVVLVGRTLSKTKLGRKRARYVRHIHSLPNDDPTPKE